MMHKSLPLPEVERLHLEAIDKEARGDNSRRRWLIQRFWKMGMENITPMHMEVRVKKKKLKYGRKRVLTR
jgi:hypothetical protein